MSANEQAVIKALQLTVQRQADKLHENHDTIAALRALNVELAAALDEFGYEIDGDLLECRDCGGYGELPTHKPDCDLAALLSRHGELRRGPDEKHQ